jgi:hypothetical protein
MVVCVAEGSHVAVADEETVDSSVEQDVVKEAVAEGEDEDGAADTHHCDELHQAVGEGEYFEETAEHAEVDHDEGQTVDDGELADLKIGLSCVIAGAPW